jgi:uncharacterized membrane-anchored protein
MNLDILDDAGNHLRELARELQLQLASKELRSMASTARQIETSRRLFELTQATAELGAECDGGIEYRIERSRYYVQQYNDILKDFRIDYVEGFQRYDVFVRRKLFSSYEFINRLGIRLQRHKRELEALGQNIQVHQNQRLNLRAAEIQLKMLKIQAAGELLLIVPLSYYSGNIVEHMRIFELMGLDPVYAFLIPLLFWAIIFGNVARIHRRKRHRSYMRTGDDDRDSASPTKRSETGIGTSR